MIGDIARDADLELARRQKAAKKKQTEVEIYNSCLAKYKQTKEHLLKLEEKKKKLEDEISHLQQKQIDRKKFLDEVKQRHQKN